VWISGNFLSDHPITRSRRSRAIPAILAAFCLRSSASNPTRHIGFVANKSETNIPPGGDRAVEGHN
jgi:hypothetical protein